jgi:hypothetical protein
MKDNIDKLQVSHAAIQEYLDQRAQNANKPPVRK